MNPTLTPLAALNLVKANNHQPVIHTDGFTYITTGPMMSPPEAWFPVAYLTEEKEIASEFYPVGDEDEDITETTEWQEIEV